MRSACAFFPVAKLETPLHIAIDNRLSAYRVGGIPEYTRRLAAALVELLAPNDRLTLIEHRRGPQPEPGRAAAVAQRRVFTPPHNRWEQLLLPLELATLRPDVLHFPDFIPLFRLPVPSVITVHDLAFLRYPEILDTQARRYYGRIGAAVRRADAIIAVSESTRHDLDELLGVAPRRVDVIYEAAAPEFRPLDIGAGEQRSVGDAHIRAGEFALFVGTLEPRKNLLLLLQALRLILDRNRVAPMLVIAGPRGWLDDPLWAAVRELRLQSHVCFAGAVDQPTLVWLYNACRIYLHPELYSGFGLPVLEAMQCGAPVIAARSSSIPEVAGDAALLLPPRAPETWAGAWEQLWDDQAARRELSALGMRRAAAFSWQRAAAATLQVYRRVVDMRAVKP